MPDEGKSNNVVIDITDTRYNVIKRCSRALNWVMVRDGKRVTGRKKSKTAKDPDSQVTKRIPWRVKWLDTGAVTHEILAAMVPGQQVNHFPGTSIIVQKCRLARVLQRLQNEYGEDLFGFHPQSWSLPYELPKLVAWWARQARRNKATIIVKPDSSSRGQGIRLLTTRAELAAMAFEPGARYAAQVYIARPLLVSGFKFDLRVYVCLAQVAPVISAFVHRRGLVRFCTTPYAKPTAENAADAFMHLSNYSINKYNTAAKHCPPQVPQHKQQTGTSDASQGGTESKDIPAQEDGCKWELEALWSVLRDQHGEARVSQLWNEIKSVVSRTLLAVQEPLRHQYVATFSRNNAHCFELLGFDILIDEHLNAILLEVNSSPSLHSDTHLDKQVKGEVVDDLFRLVNHRATSHSTNTSPEQTKPHSNSPRAGEEEVLRSHESSADHVQMGGFEAVLPLDQSAPHFEELTAVARDTPSVYQIPAKEARRRKALGEERSLEKERRATHSNNSKRPPWGGRGSAGKGRETTEDITSPLPGTHATTTIDDERHECADDRQQTCQTTDEDPAAQERYAQYRKHAKERAAAASQRRLEFLSRAKHVVNRRVHQAHAHAYGGGQVIGGAQQVASGPALENRTVALLPWSPFATCTSDSSGGTLGFQGVSMHNNNNNNNNNRMGVRPAPPPMQSTPRSQSYMSSSGRMARTRLPTAQLLADFSHVAHSGRTTTNRSTIHHALGKATRQMQPQIDLQARTWHVPDLRPSAFAKS
jgi:tubulin polyglutamylase TTLL6/13